MAVEINLLLGDVVLHVEISGKGRVFDAGNNTIASTDIRRKFIVGNYGVADTGCRGDVGNCCV